MQGFFQIARFGIPREPEVTEEGEAAVADYILVSRRSRDRAGLRYQRRGIDDDANVANFVETETILRVEVSCFVAHNGRRLTLCSARGLPKRVQPCAGSGVESVLSMRLPCHSEH